MAEAEGQVRPSRSRSNFAIFAVVLLLLAAGWGIWWMLVGSQRIRTNDAYVQGNIVPVQAQTEATVRRVYVEDTEYVHAGALLASVQGDRSYLALKASEAALGRTVRELRREFAEVRRLQHSLDAQRAEYAKLGENLSRYRKAQAGGAVATIRITDTQADMRVLQAQMGATRAKLAAALALVGNTNLSDNPLVRAAVTRVESAYLSWARRDLRAPVSGYVAQRHAYPGLRIHPGQQLFSIVPLHGLWVVANVKETEMAQVRPGDTVRLTSYYYGDSVVYRGVVEGLVPGAGSAFSILPPENATGNYIHIVERVPLRISLPAKALAKHPLRPGLSMVARIDIAGKGKRSVLAPLTKTPVEGYETGIYRRELQRARQLAQRIIAQNAG
ncbi:HlyD family efflux transporter periplasmic adaptor subunit [Acidithiobacillus caldus]|uniref:Membrane fusion component of tripartite multidrug resistance system n=2 Tax=Acidithiobacillus caldus TaxID=33059 RepID=F9ZP16_ACICS|nr:efflux RND transporter periplasmic adaptor subunit [Acidithiobacillus caldus]AEK58011.1 Membrane fusion component of tripartite multidrug resistance system [Acidithiobacillus caldus SM-1]AUW32674.1 HlyD family efflux transporter periplasmic adaptor subunit [Acidithiobacillus caldus]OFC37264.1 multidrug transporter [Acidithiobacillus caldus]OFC40349.1 multidrug transporter [Acidithiobacillus caldus]QER44764.1 Secretion protein HlyD family [Acidithiobacillus caldus]